jgi:hypothetical protein
MPCDKSMIVLPNFEASPAYRKEKRLGKPYFRGPCPAMGGTDRFDFYPEGHPRSVHPGVPVAICNCGFQHFYGEVNGTAVYTVPDPEPLDPLIALAYHSKLDDKRKYWHSHKLSDKWIDCHKLGWAEKWLEGENKGNPLRRLSIPTWRVKNGERILVGIAYRTPPWREEGMRKAGTSSEEIRSRRYISQPGSTNWLFNNEICHEPLPYLIVVEGKRDALALCSLGFPAVASGAHWDPHWSFYLDCTASVIHVADNDHNKGGDLAIIRMSAAQKGSIVTPPDPYKDVGEMINNDIDMASFLGLPPLRGF